MTLNFSTASSTARSAPHARGIDQSVALAVAFEGHQHGIARGARLIEGHHAIFAEQAIDQRALADIRPADHRHLDAVDFRAVLRVRAQARKRRLEQGNHALVVGCGNGMRFTQSHLVKIGHRHVLIEAFGFIHRQAQWLAAAAGQLRHELVLRGDSGAAVHHHDQPSASLMARSVCSTIKLSMAWRRHFRPGRRYRPRCRGLRYGAKTRTADRA